MEKVTRRKQSVLDTLDENIEELEEKLKKVQPLIDELAVLRRTRATLLDERRPTGGGGRRGTMLSLEQVVQFMRENGASTPQEVADKLGVSDTVVRSHFNRYADSRYAKNGDGKWRLIGENTDEEDDE
jgi:response regulator of citrate/malate metabolism